MYMMYMIIRHLALVHPNSVAAGQDSQTDLGVSFLSPSWVGRSCGAQHDTARDR